MVTKNKLDTKSTLTLFFLIFIEIQSILACTTLILIVLPKTLLSMPVLKHLVNLANQNKFRCLLITPKKRL